MPSVDSQAIKFHIRTYANRTSRINAFKNKEQRTSDIDNIMIQEGTMMILFFYFHFYKYFCYCIDVYKIKLLHAFSRTTVNRFHSMRTICIIII